MPLIRFFKKSRVAAKASKVLSVTVEKKMDSDKPYIGFFPIKVRNVN